MHYIKPSTTLFTPSCREYVFFYSLRVCYSLILYSWISLSNRLIFSLSRLIISSFIFNSATFFVAISFIYRSDFILPSRSYSFSDLHNRFSAYSCLTISNFSMALFLSSINLIFSICNSLFTAIECCNYESNPFTYPLNDSMVLQLSFTFCVSNLISSSASFKVYLVSSTFDF